MNPTQNTDIFALNVETYFHYGVSKNAVLYQIVSIKTMVLNFKLQLFTKVVDHIYFIISSQIYIMNTKNQTNLSQLIIGKYERLKTFRDCMMLTRTSYYTIVHTSTT